MIIDLPIKRVAKEKNPKDIYIITKELRKKIGPNEIIKIGIVGIYQNQEDCYRQYVKCVYSENVKYAFVHLKEDGTHVGMMGVESEAVRGRSK